MKRFAMLFAMLIPLTGCATMGRGTTQGIFVWSDPPGATVSTDKCGVPNGEWTTPVNVEVARRAKSCTLTVSKWGFLPETVRLSRHRDSHNDVDLQDEDMSLGASFFFFLVGEAISLGLDAVDSATGAVYALDPPILELRLELAPMAEEALDPGYPWTDESPPSRER